MPRATAPTPKELNKKLQDALSAIQEEDYAFVEDRHLTSDMDKLFSESAEDHMERIAEFIQEIITNGGARCYNGHRTQPPLKCSNPRYPRLELFPFVWCSPSEGKDMYIKFGITYDAQKKPTYLYLNCHEQTK